MVLAKARKALSRIPGKIPFSCKLRPATDVEASLASTAAKDNDDNYLWCHHTKIQQGSQRFVSTLRTILSDARIQDSRYGRTLIIFILPLSKRRATY